MKIQLKQWPLIALIVGLVVLITIVAALSFQIGRRIARSTPFVPMPTRSFPSIQTSTPTPRPTHTTTPTPTGTPTRTPTPTSTPTFTPTPTPTPRVIINHVQALGRLETSRYMLSTVIDLKREPNDWWEKLFGTDAILLVAEGEVVAGIDMTAITPQDILVSGDSVSIVLPPAEILYSKLDNQHTYVYSRTKPPFRPPDETLEGEARQKAEQAMLNRAIEGGILKDAEANARARVESFLRMLGFTQVTVTIRSK